MLVYLLLLLSPSLSPSLQWVESLCVTVSLFTRKRMMSELLVRSAVCQRWRKEEKDLLTAIKREQFNIHSDKGSVLSARYSKRLSSWGKWKQKINDRSIVHERTPASDVPSEGREKKLRDRKKLNDCTHHYYVANAMVVLLVFFLPSPTLVFMFKWTRLVESFVRYFRFSSLPSCVIHLPVEDTVQSKASLRKERWSVLLQVTKCLWGGEADTSNLVISSFSFSLSHREEWQVQCEETKVKKTRRRRYCEAI